MVQITNDMISSKSVSVVETLNSIVIQSALRPDKLVLCVSDHSKDFRTIVKEEFMKGFVAGKADTKSANVLCFYNCFIVNAILFYRKRWENINETIILYF